MISNNIKKKISNIIYKKVQIKKFSFFKSSKNKIIELRFKKLIQKLYIINNSKVVQMGNESLAILSKNNLVEELCFQSKNLIRKDIYYNKILKKGYFSLFSKKINGTALSLLQDVSIKKNYFHFLYDAISKLYWIEKYKINFEYLLLPDLKHKFHYDIIKELSLKCKIINCSKYRSLNVKRLIVIDHPYWKINSYWKNDIKNIPTWSIKYLRKKFYHKGFKKKFIDRFYIDRSNSINSHNQIANFDKLREILLEHNFKIIQLSSLRFKDQINLFKNAKLIIGPHDAGFANIAFCKPKTEIIEFRQKNGVQIDKISETLKLNHSVWFTKTNKKKQMVINLKKLKNYLSNK